MPGTYSYRTTRNENKYQVLIRIEQQGTKISTRFPGKISGRILIGKTSKSALRPAEADLKLARLESRRNPARKPDLRPGSTLAADCITVYWFLIIDCWRLTIDCWTSTTDYWLLITDHWLLTMDYWLLTADYWRLTTESWKLITDYWILTTDYWLLITVYWQLKGGLVEAATSEQPSGSEKRERENERDERERRDREDIEKEEREKERKR